MVSSTPRDQLLSERLGRRAAAGIVDQVIFSLQNFAVTFVALRSLELAELGEFTLTFTVVLLVVVSVRSFVLEPLAISYSAASSEARATAASMAAGCSLLIGVVGCVVCGIAAAVAGRPVIAAAGVALPFVLVQDAWRATLFAARQPARAAVNDGVTLVMTLAAMFALSSFHSLSGVAILMAWTAGAACGAFYGVLQLSTLPHPRLSVAWIREQGEVGLPLVGSTLAQQAAGRLSLIAVASIAGSAALGRITAAQVVLSPLNTVVAAIFSISLPEAVRRLHFPRHEEAEARSNIGRLRRYTTLMSLGLAAATVTWTALLYILPDSLGRLLAGTNWQYSKELLLPTSLWILGTAISQGSRVGLRALKEAGATFRVSAALGGGLVVATTFGTLIAGAPGAAWGFGLASMLGQVPWAWTYTRARQRAGEPPESTRLSV